MREVVGSNPLSLPYNRLALQGGFFIFADKGRCVLRNRTFDLFKWAAALFVLLLHVPFPGDVGGTVRMFARWAVPFFFMVSGYFTYGAVQRQDAGRLLRRMRRL